MKGGPYIVEGIAGMWSYHISTDVPYRALCGAQTMNTSIPIERWESVFGEHFPKRPTWCSECASKAGLRGTEPKKERHGKEG